MSTPATRAAISAHPPGGIKNGGGEDAGHGKPSIASSGKAGAYGVSSIGA